MALNLQQIRDFVRVHLDIEEEDLPDTVLDIFIREGSKRIERAEDRWPFYESTFDLQTAAAQEDYPFADISTELESIHAIRGEQWELKALGTDEGDYRWARNLDQTSEPSHFSVWAKVLRLYPIPDGAYDLIIRGYRKPIDWVGQGAGAEPDLPDELHNTVATWALGKAYMQQEDPEMASVYERQFADELNEFRRRIAAEETRPQPIVLNGHTSPSSMPYAMRYDWGYTYA